MNSEHIPNGQVSDERLRAIANNKSFGAGEIASIAGELLTLRSSAGVKVKVLEWVRLDSGECWAQTFVGLTYVANEHGWQFRNGTLTRVDGGVEAAKAAAQADFNTRILSALSSPSHIGEEPTQFALRNAYEEGWHDGKNDKWRNGGRPVPPQGETSVEQPERLKLHRKIMGMIADKQRYAGVMLDGRDLHVIAEALLDRAIDAEKAATASQTQGAGADRDSLRIARQFADMYRSGASGTMMDCDAAMALALSIDDILTPSPTLEPTDAEDRLRQLTRYSVKPGSEISARMVPDANGQWLSYGEAAALIQELEAALVAAENDTARLDYLDSLNASLNARHGTRYGWSMVVNQNVNRVMFNFPRGADLSDYNPHGFGSCRNAIDQRMHETAAYRRARSSLNQDGWKP